MRRVTGPSLALAASAPGGLPAAGPLRVVVFHVSDPGTPFLDPIH